MTENQATGFSACQVGASGKAITLVSELDGRRVAEIERLLGEKVARVELEGFEYRKVPAVRERRAGARPARRKAPPRRGRSRGTKGKVRKRGGNGASS